MEAGDCCYADIAGFLLKLSDAETDVGVQRLRLSGEGGLGEPV